MLTVNVNGFRVGDDAQPRNENGELSVYNLLAVPLLLHDSSSRRLLVRLHVSMKTASMKSLTVGKSRCTAASFAAFTSSRGQRTCNGTGFDFSGFFLVPPLGVVAAVGLVVVEGTGRSDLGRWV